MLRVLQPWELLQQADELLDREAADEPTQEGSDRRVERARILGVVDRAQEAGADELVDRIVNILAQGRTTVDRIVAVTFTVTVTESFAIPGDSI